MPSDTLFTEIQHPATPKYAQDRQRQINECLRMTEPELKQLLKNTINNSAPLRDEGNMTSKILGEMQTSPMVPASVKGILDTTGSTTGNALLRQDLEPILFKRGGFSQ